MRGTTGWKETVQVGTLYFALHFSIKLKLFPVINPIDLINLLNSGLILVFYVSHK